MAKQSKWTPPSDAVEQKSTPQWTPPTDAIEVKKKVESKPSATGQPTPFESFQAGLATSQSASPTGLQQAGITQQRIPTQAPLTGLDVRPENIKAPTMSFGEEETISAPVKVQDVRGKVQPAKEVFKPVSAKGYTVDQTEFSKGGNQYRLNTLPTGEQAWEVKREGQEDFTVLSDPGSISSLNKSFDKKVSPEKTQLFEQQRQKQLKNQSVLNNITPSVIAANEELVVPYVNNQLKELGIEDDFLVEEIGAGTNAIQITNKVTGEKQRVGLSNFSDERNKVEAEVLKAFIGNYAFNKDYYQKKKQINDLSVYDPMKDVESHIEDNKNLSKLKDEVKTIEKSRDRYINDNVSRATAEKNVKQNIANYKAELSGVNVALIDLQTETEQFQNYLASFNAQAQAGGMSQEDFELKRAELAQRQAGLQQKQEQLKEQTEYATSRIDFNEDVVADAYKVNSERGNIASGTAQAFTRGMEAPLRMIGNAFERQSSSDPDYIPAEKSAFGDDEYGWSAGVSTLDYTKSANRDDFSKAIFGVAESLGSAVTGTLLTGGVLKGGGGGKGLAEKTANLVNIGTFASMYNASRDQMEGPEFKDVPLAEKVFLSTIIAAPQMVLEQFGLSQALKGTRLGKSLSNNILSRVLTTLPKGASAETIETAIKKNVTELIKDGILRVNKAGLIEAGTEASQYLVEVGIGELYNQAKGKDLMETPNSFMELVENVGENAKIGYIGGVTMGGASQAITQISGGNKISKSDYSALENTLTDPDLKEAFSAYIATQLLNGDITAEEAQRRLENAGKMEEKLASIPKELDEDSRAEAFNLIQERDALEERTAPLDKALAKYQTDRISEINAQLEEMGRRAVTGETEAEVAAETETEAETQSETKPAPEKPVETPLPTIVQEEGAATEYTDQEGKFYSEKEVLDMAPEQRSLLTLQNPSPEIMSAVQPIPEAEVLNTANSPQLESNTSNSRDIESAPVQTESIAITNPADVTVGQTLIDIDGRESVVTAIDGNTIVMDRDGSEFRANPKVVELFTKPEATISETETVQETAPVVEETATTEQNIPTGTETATGAENAPVQNEPSAGKPARSRKEIEAEQEKLFTRAMGLKQNEYDRLIAEGMSEVDARKKANEFAENLPEAQRFNELNDEIKALKENNQVQESFSDQSNVTQENESSSEQAKPENETKPAPEKQEKPAEKKPEKKVSKQADRFSEMQDDPETKKRINELASYDVQNQEEFSAAMDEIINTLGVDGAVDYVNDLNNQVAPEVRIAVLTEAGASISQDAMEAKAKALKTQDKAALLEAEAMLEKGMALIIEASLYKTKAGQINSYTRKTYSKYPSVFQIELTERFNRSYGAIESVRNDAVEMREDIRDGLNNVVDDFFNDSTVLEMMQEEIDDLRRQVGDLTARQNEKKQNREEKVRKAKKKFDDALAKFKGRGQISGAIAFLSSEQVEAIGEMVKALIEMGYANTNKIVNEIYEAIKQTVPNVRKEHIRIAARNINEFNVMQVSERQQREMTKIDRLRKKLSDLMSGEFEKEIREIQEDSQVAKELKEKISEIQRIERLSKRLEDLENGIESKTTSTTKEDSKEVSELKEKIKKLKRLRDLESQLAKLQRGEEDIDITEREEDSQEIKELKKQIADERVLTSKAIKQLVKDFLAGKIPNVSSLAQALAQKTGKTESEMQDMADIIEETLNARIEQLVAKEHARFVEKQDRIKTPLEELRRARREGTITAEQLAELEERIENTRTRKEIEQIMALMRSGRLNDTNEFTRAFEKRFGFRQLPSHVKAQLDAIAFQIFEMEKQVEKEIIDANGDVRVVTIARREQIGRLQKQFNTLLEASKPWTVARVLKEIVSAQYVNMLSGPLTFVRAFYGGYSSGAFGALSYTLRNIHKPKSLFNGFTAAWRSLPAAWRRATQSRKTGYDLFGQSSLKGDTNQDSQGWYEKTLLTGLQEALDNKEYGKAALKTVGQLLKVIHALGGLDAFMNTVSGVYIGTIKQTQQQQYDKVLNETLDQDYRAIAEEEFQESTQRIQDFVEANFPSLTVEQKQEKVNKLMKAELGLTGSRFNARKTYMINRVQELREQALGNLFVDGVQLAKDSSMMGTPDGYVGILVEKYLKPVLNIKDEDSAGVAVGKFFLNALFKFVRITGQLINKTFNNIPVLGIANAFIGPGYNPRTGEFDTRIFKGKLNSNPDLLKQRVFNNILITSLTVAGYLAMFEDDEEEGWKLREDRPFDLRAFGKGGQGGKYANERKYEDFQNLSISFSRGKDGKFENYISFRLNPEISAVLATLGSLSDMLKGDATDKQIRAFQVSPYKTAFFKALGDNAKIFTESSFSSIGRIVKNIQGEENFFEGLLTAGQNLAIDNTRPLINPAAFQSITKAVESSAGENQKQTQGWQYLANNLYGLDGFIGDEKTDVFGNKFPEENDYERFMKEFVGEGEKRSENYKNAALLYKFDEGLNISKRKFAEMLPTAPKGFSVTYSSPFGKRTEKYFVNDDGSIAKEAQDIQEKEFNRYVNENYDYLNKLKTKEDLEEAMKEFQQESVDFAKEKIIEKYEGTKKLTLQE